MTNNLKSGERLDDLQLNGLQIIQDPERFCFGIDAVMLSDFARVKPGRRFWIWEPEPGSYRFYCPQRPEESILSDLRFKKKVLIWREEV